MLSARDYQNLDLLPPIERDLAERRLRSAWNDPIFKRIWPAFQRYLAPEQTLAALDPSPFLLIHGPPASGKTTTLIARFLLDYASASSRERPLLLFSDRRLLEFWSPFLDSVFRREEKAFETAGDPSGRAGRNWTSSVMTVQFFLKRRWEDGGKSDNTKTIATPLQRRHALLLALEKFPDFRAALPPFERLLGFLRECKTHPEMAGTLFAEVSHLEPLLYAYNAILDAQGLIDIDDLPSRLRPEIDEVKEAGSLFLTDFSRLFPVWQKAALRLARFASRVTFVSTTTQPDLPSLRIHNFFRAFSPAKKLLDDRKLPRCWAKPKSAEKRDGGSRFIRLFEAEEAVEESARVAALVGDFVKHHSSPSESILPSQPAILYYSSFFFGLLLSRSLTHLDLPFATDLPNPAEAFPETAALAAWMDLTSLALLPVSHRRKHRPLLVDLLRVLLHHPTFVGAGTSSCEIEALADAFETFDCSPRRRNLPLIHSRLLHALWISPSRTTRPLPEFVLERSLDFLGTEPVSCPRAVFQLELERYRFLAAKQNHDIGEPGEVLARVAALMRRFPRPPDHSSPPILLLKLGFETLPAGLVVLTDLSAPPAHASRFPGARRRYRETKNLALYRAFTGARCGVVLSRHRRPPASGKSFFHSEKNRPDPLFTFFRRMGAPRLQR
ncbi:MAG: hypothetical protein D6679_11275 [Candidatus Hydrogenedentota bacterium]|nr:MAG: hypothetical protein D6679_11275 [Candidatus Hydrogenedentota bacterium]